MRSMKNLALLLVLVAVGLAQSTYTFEAFKAEFKKSYVNAEQQSFRRQNFDFNLQRINDLNSLSPGYQLGWNAFMDRSLAELSSFLTASVDTTAKITSSENIVPKVGRPASYDWRDYKKVTAIKDQGTCGSCWAFSSVAAYQSLLLMKTNTIYDLAEQFVLECASVESGCAGGYASDATSILSTSGAPLEKAYRYAAASSGSRTPSTSGICTPANPIKLPTSTSAASFAGLSSEKIYTMLLSGPLVGLVKADSGFQFYKNGVYACNGTVGSAELNHAVAIIGYDANGNFLIKNSWGASWGVNGFMNLSNDNDCGLKLFIYQLINDAPLLEAGTTDPDPLTQAPPDYSNSNTTTPNNTTPNNTTPNNTTPNNTTPSSWSAALCTSLVLAAVALLTLF